MEAAKWIVSFDRHPSLQMGGPYVVIFGHIVEDSVLNAFHVSRVCHEEKCTTMRRSKKCPQLPAQTNSRDRFHQLPPFFAIRISLQTTPLPQFQMKLPTFSNSAGNETLISRRKTRRCGRRTKRQMWCERASTAIFESDFTTK